MVEISWDIPATTCSAAWANPLPFPEESRSPHTADVSQLIRDGL